MRGSDEPDGHGQNLLKMSIHSSSGGTGSVQQDWEEAGHIAESLAFSRRVKFYNWRRKAECFWQKVDRSAGPDGCWPFQGRLDIDGYGFHGNQRAHRFACGLAYGDPRPGEVAKHAPCCPRRDCCNPAHLSWGTQKENVADAIAAGTHRNCRPYGKPYVCGACGGRGHNTRTCPVAAQVRS